MLSYVHELSYKPMMCFSPSSPLSVNRRAEFVIRNSLKIELSSNEMPQWLGCPAIELPQWFSDLTGRDAPVAEPSNRRDTPVAEPSNREGCPCG